MTYTLDRLVETVNALGLLGRKGEHLSRTHYHRILQHPIYCGIIRYSGEEYEGKHERIIRRSSLTMYSWSIGRRSKPKRTETQAIPLPRPLPLRRMRLLHHH